MEKNQESNNSKKAILISIASDIGTALCARWKEREWDIYGTYRTKSDVTSKITAGGVKLFHCDLLNNNSIRQACSQLVKSCPQWDVLVLCSGALEPIGAFSDVDFREWEKSVRINFTSQMEIIQRLLPARRQRTKPEPIVIFFAGGGTNNAPVNHSAYTISKIALIKMTELLDAEIPDARFVIIGPGWVKTKIHEATLKAGEKAGENYRLTREKLAGGACTSMEAVLDCLDWAVNAPRKEVSGRNFSVVYDKWGDPELEKSLFTDPDLYKLRRYGNDWRKK